jgi:hypothetical protein
MKTAPPPTLLKVGGPKNVKKNKNGASTNFVKSWCNRYSKFLKSTKKTKSIPNSCQTPKSPVQSKKQNGASTNFVM